MASLISLLRGYNEKIHGSFEDGACTWELSAALLMRQALTL